MKRLLMLIALMLSTVQASAKISFVNKNDLHYGPHERNVFDIWYPKSRLRSVPLVVFIHGGGFSSGDKSYILKNFPNVVKQYNSDGIAFATINYRYLKHAPLQTIMREDIAGFIQYIRYNAKKFRIDKTKILSFGFSAGGSASLWLGTHDDLADPNNENPLKRESSKPLAIGHCNAQLTYDMVDWIELMGQALVDKYLKDQLWSRYHFKSADDLKTEEGIAVRKDLDMYENMTMDDPAMIFWNNLPQQEIDSADQFYHAPRHARPLAEKAKKLGLVFESHILADGAGNKDVMGAVHDFFVKQINR